MRILIAVTSHLSYRLVQGQIKYLTSKGHDLYFCSSYCKDTEINVIEEGGKYIPLNLDREINVFKDFLSVYKAYKILKKIQPDIINISTAKASFVFSLASLIYRKTIVVHTLRGLRSDTLKGLKYSVVKFTETLMCSISDKVIVISPSLKTHVTYKKILKPHKTIVFGKGSSNGINVERFSPTTNNTLAANLFRNKNDINKDDVVFGHVGRVVNDKGIVELYDAFEVLKKLKYNVKLLLVGSLHEEDRISDELIERIKEDKDVYWLDYTSRIEVIFTAIDVLVLYSYREGFGNVVIEAAAMYKPAIVANIPGLKDTVVNNTTGLLCPPKDKNKLVDKMIILYENKELRLKMGVNGRERVLDYFSNEIIWNHLQKLYQSLYNSNC